MEVPMPRLHAVQSLLAAAWLLGAGAAAAQLPPPDTSLRVEPLAEGLYVLFGSGGNMALSVGPDATFLVDDQFAPMTPSIQKAVADLAAPPVRFVLNTHWHGDHTGGNENLGKAGAVIVAHDNVRGRMSVPQMIEFFQRAVPASPPEALPVVTFNDEASFHLNGDEIRAIHVPHAHTDGDVLVHFRRANVIHAGDTFFNGSYPFIDVDSGGSVAGLIACVDRLLALADAATKIVPGHGPVSGRAELEAYRAMLVATTGRIAELVAEGLDAEAIVAAKPTEAYDAAWTGSFINGERYTRMVVRALEKVTGDR
jgi:glyoxylase-like metal-dependent hydrolase (beta-lactamase superfamily II)